MKTTTCKKCSRNDLYWIQLANRRWMLQDNLGNQHRCDTDTIVAVKCKYCSADDLHWGEDIRQDGTKKAVLTESYGLPHACDERQAFVAKEKQDKKDKYQAIKAKVEASPIGTCQACKGSGRGSVTGSFGSYCEHCRGHGRFDDRIKRQILHNARLTIWPNIAKHGKNHSY